MDNDELYEEEDELEFLPEIKDRVKENIDLYYKDKSLIKDEEVLEVLDKAYDWLYNLLTDGLDNVKSFEPNGRYKDDYDVLYGNSKNIILLGYDKKNRTNKVHPVNFYVNFRIYMEDYITDNYILISIVHGYLVNILGMRGKATFLCTFK